MIGGTVAGASAVTGRGGVRGSLWDAAAVLVATMRRRSGGWWLLAALLVALASLPFGRALAFDASAWVVWGRELWSLGLDTSAGPSWKPFPIFFTAPFAVLGDASGAAWLVVARAGALLAVVGAGRLAARVGGAWGGAVAAVAVVLSPWWLLNGALGNADPLLGALVVWALLAAADGAPRRAFALGVLGALVRPEIWPFLAVYALVLVVRRRLPLVPVLASGVAVLALWVVPDLLSSGLSSTRGATGTASAGSASLTDHPFLTVWKDLGAQAPWIALLAALVGAATLGPRWRRGGDGRDAGATVAHADDASTAGRATPAGTGEGRTGLPGGRGRRLAAIERALPPADPRTWLLLAAAYTLLVAVMAQAGFAGNPRYLVPALTLVAAAAGTVVALGRLPALAQQARLAVPLIALVVIAALAVAGASELRDQARMARDRADGRQQLRDAIAAAGGHERLRRCGPVRSGPGPRTLVAELLHESVPQAAVRPRPGDATARVDAAGRWTVVPPACR